MLLYEFINEAIEKNPDKKVLISRGIECTYRQLADKMNLWAKTLLSLGVGKGDRVALFMKNRVELVTMYFACFRIGAIAVPLNTRYKTPEAEFALTQSGSKIIISSSELFPVVAEMTNDVSSLEKAFIVDEDSSHNAPSWSYAVSRCDDSVSFPQVNESDPAIIIYTSGSTARPKGAVHTHHSLYTLTKYKTESQDYGHNETALAATQVSHIAGFAGLMLPAVYNGGTFVMEKEFEAGDYIDHLKKFKPTMIVLLPTELLEILEHPRAKEADFSHINYMLIAGDKVPHHTYELFRKLAGFDLTEGCGMTECEGYCLQPKHGMKKPGSIGKPITGVKMKLVDKNDNEVPDGETGEILLQSDALITEYWDNPEANAKDFVNGWFRTGDLAYKDQDGYYHFVSRIKEIIIRGGSNISPGEVEDVIDDHPAVLSSGVVGFPDEHYGQIVGAFIVTEPGMPTPTVEELKTFASERLAQYKIPEKWIFVDHIPENAVGKIDRRKLHQLAGKYIVTESSF